MGAVEASPIGDNSFDREIWKLRLGSKNGKILGKGLFSNKGEHKEERK